MKTGKILTADKVSIDYEWDDHGADSAVIICHGFFNSKQNRTVRRTVGLLSERFDTVLLDFRGHGKSGGLFTWSAREYQDLEAVIDLVRPNYKSLGIVGFSLGAATSIITAARRPDIDSMILIGCPCSFWTVNFHFWEIPVLYDLAGNVKSGFQGKGARVSHMFTRKTRPVDAVARLKDIPLFFIHGDQDWVVKHSHSQKLYRAKPGEKKIEIIPRGFHAEWLIAQFPDQMKKLMLDWFAKTLR